MTVNDTKTMSFWFKLYFGFTRQKLFHQVYATKIYFGDFVMFYGFFNIHLCLRSWKKIKEQSDYGYLPRSEIRRIWTILKDAIAIFNRKL